MEDFLGDPVLSLVVRLFVAFGIGALIGMERERSESAGAFAGSRTFPLIGLYGAIVQAFVPDSLPVAILALAAPLTVAYAGKVWLEGDLGLTTLTAALLTVVLGALTTHSTRGLLVAVVVGGIATVVLSEKARIHRVADRIEAAEQRAIVKFVLVVMVVFPLLPDRDIEWLFGLNPRFIWLMVVLVTGLSFLAYALSHTVGPSRGIALTGVLGGFVSSTATAVSMAERTRQSPTLYRICAFSTVIASVVMFPRALIEVAIVNPDLLTSVAIPLGAMTMTGAIVATFVYWRSTAEPDIDTDIENPFRLAPALVFGVLFAIVLVVADYANLVLGSSGVYATAFITGLVGIDAITLSLSKLSADGAIAPAVATTGIVIATIANTLVKVGLVWILGSRELGKLVTAILGVVAGVGLLTVLIL